MKGYTDLEQSKKLEKILPLESADLYYDIGFDKDYHIKMPTNGYFGNKRFFIQFPETVPCWSLAALLELIPNYQLQTQDNGIGILFGHKKGFEEVTAECPLDACVAMIEKLHELKML